MTSRNYALTIVMCLLCLVLSACGGTSRPVAVPAEPTAEGPAQRGAVNNPNDLSCTDSSIKPADKTTVTLSEQSVILKIHNDERKLTGGDPLVWDEELAKHAQGWVDAIVKFNAAKQQGKENPLLLGVHSSLSDGNPTCYSTKYGNHPENITSGGATAEVAAGLWIEEKPNWKAGKCEPEECGHYIQAVAHWVGKIGCGHNPDSSWACSYDSYGGMLQTDGTYVDPFIAYDTTATHGFQCYPSFPVPTDSPFKLCQDVFVFDGSYDQKWYQGYIASYRGGAYSVNYCGAQIGQPPDSCGTEKLTPAQIRENLISMSEAQSRGIKAGDPKK